MRRLSPGIPRVQWTPIEALELAGKRGRVQIRGRAYELAFDDCLDLVQALERAGLAAGARMLLPGRRAAIVNRAKLELVSVLAGRGAEPEGEHPPEGLEDCYYLGVTTPAEVWHNWIFFVEDAYIALHRMNRILQGLHPRGAAAAVHAALAKRAAQPVH
jgi:hypothetical protein